MELLKRTAGFIAWWVFVFAFVMGGDLAVQAVLGREWSGVWPVFLLGLMFILVIYRGILESDEHKIRRCTKETNRLLYNAALRKKRAEERNAKRGAAALAGKGWRFKDWTPPGPPDPRPSGLPPSND